MPRAPTTRLSVQRYSDAAPEPPLLVSVNRAARELDVTTRTIHRLVSNGTLESVRVGRSRRITFRSLLRIAHGNDHGQDQ
jgi:excisionase family DNA binding protein